MSEMQPINETETHFCRLCWQKKVPFADIYEHNGVCDVPPPVNFVEKKLSKLFQVQFRMESSLPFKICEMCMELTNTFETFQGFIEQSEKEIQMRTLNRSEENVRPGLNGAPGVFVPQPNEEIVEVDFEKIYESSDEDCSIESDEKTISERKSQAAEDEEMPTLLAADPLQLPLVTIAKEADNANSSEVKEQIQNFDNISDYILTGQKAHLCEYCDKAYSDQERCIEHEQAHDKEFPHTCIICPTRMPTRGLLISHIRSEHDARRPFMCSMCIKRFGRRSDLKKHSILHTSVRPYTCQICEKSFSHKTNLHKHLRIHRSSKPHICKMCPRTFATSDELLQHNNNHLQRKPFQCSKCSSSFARMAKLKMHERVHHQRDAEEMAMQYYFYQRDLHQQDAAVFGMTFDCMECDAKFDCLRELNKHTVEKHCSTSASAQMHAASSSSQMKESAQPMLFKMLAAAQQSVPNQIQPGLEELYDSSEEENCI